MKKCDDTISPQFYCLAPVPSVVIFLRFYCTYVCNHLCLLVYVCWHKICGHTFTSGCVYIL